MKILFYNIENDEIGDSEFIKIMVYNFSLEKPMDDDMTLIRLNKLSNIMSIKKI